LRKIRKPQSGEVLLVMLLLLMVVL